MSADIFGRLFDDMARVFAPVEPGDFATPNNTTPPSPDATPPAWARQTREGADL